MQAHCAIILELIIIHLCWFVASGNTYNDCNETYFYIAFIIFTNRVMEDIESYKIFAHFLS